MQVAIAFVRETTQLAQDGQAASLQVRWRCSAIAILARLIRSTPWQVLQQAGNRQTSKIVGCAPRMSIVSHQLPPVAGSSCTTRNSVCADFQRFWCRRRCTPLCSRRCGRRLPRWTAACSAASWRQRLPQHHRPHAAAAGASWGWRLCAAPDVVTEPGGVASMRLFFKRCRYAVETYDIEHLTHSFRANLTQLTD